MLKLRTLDHELEKLEVFLTQLLDRFNEDHGHHNVQITFSNGIWGFLDNGNFNEIGTLKDLDKWLRSAHCEKCSNREESRQYEIKHHIRDEDGHLEYFEDWNKAWLKTVAREEGVPVLTGDHMIVIKSLRRYYERNGIPPMVRVIKRETGFGVKEIYDLFPKGPSSAGKIAGIPKARGHD